MTVRPRRAAPEQGLLDALGRSFGALLVVVVAAAALPTVVVAWGLALLLRSAGLRWTWAPLLAAVLAVPVAVDASGRVDAVRELAQRALRGGRVTEGLVLAAVWPWWLAVAGLVLVGVRLALDRRARVHGGKAELARAREVGPVGLVVRLVRRGRARRAPVTAAGVVLGAGARGPVRVAGLRTHAMIVGGSGSGKTSTAMVLLEGEVAGGRGFVVLDGKGGRTLPRFAAELGGRYGRRVALWSVLPYGVAALDALRCAWNAAGGGNPTEVKDRVASAEEQREPYYAAIAARGLLCAAQALVRGLGRDPTLDELARLLDAPARLVAQLRAVDRAAFAREIAWLEQLTEGERSGLRGMGTRLATMVASDGGEWLIPAPGRPAIDLHQAVTEGWLVVFTLPEGTYPALVPHVCRYVLAALNAVATRLEREGRQAGAVGFVDELSAFDGDQLAGGLERGRSAGLSYIVATQSLSNFRSAGGEKLLDAVLDNSELLVIHRQSSPAAAEQLAGVAGTKEAWEHTHAVRDRHAGRLLGDESGDRTRRLTEQFRAHPNEIKQLPTGHAIVIRRRPSFDVARVHVRLRTIRPS